MTTTRKSPVSTATTSSSPVTAIEFSHPEAQSATVVDRDRVTPVITPFVS